MRSPLWARARQGAPGPRHRRSRRGRSRGARPARSSLRDSGSPRPPVAHRPGSAAGFGLGIRAPEPQTGRARRSARRPPGADRPCPAWPRRHQHDGRRARSPGQYRSPSKPPAPDSANAQRRGSGVRASTCWAGRRRRCRPAPSWLRAPAAASTRRAQHCQRDQAGGRRANGRPGGRACPCGRTSRSPTA